jgi:predicted dithiol-disulfide oxidoreductase (DUF899 family)
VTPLPGRKNRASDDRTFPAGRFGFSCFLREGDEIFHTYSTYGRGTDHLVFTYGLLDLTALGRQEDWEEPKDRVAAVRGGDPTFTS